MPTPHDSQWPQIKRDLVTKIEGMGQALRDLKTSYDQKVVDDEVVLKKLHENIQNHHDILYGFRRADNGEWVDGIIQWMSNMTTLTRKREKKMVLVYSAAVGCFFSTAATLFLTFIHGGPK